MLSRGLPLGKEAEFWVGKREDTPHPPLWSAGQEDPYLCSPRRGWGGGTVLGTGCGKIRGRGEIKLRYLSCLGGNLFPLQVCGWQEGWGGGRRIKRGVSRRGQHLPSSWASLRELDQDSWFTSTPGWAHGSAKTGAFFLKILPGRVSGRNEMTCFRRERGESGSIASVMTAGVCTLPCFLGCSVWLPRGKRGPQRYPVLLCLTSLGPRATDGSFWPQTSLWTGAHQGAGGQWLLQPPCAYNCPSEWFGLLGWGLPYRLHHLSDLLALEMPSLFRSCIR